MTLAELEQLFPFIEWRRPVPVKVTALGERWVCRVCIATEGLSARELFDKPFAFEDEADCVAHIEEHAAVGGTLV